MPEWLERAKTDDYHGGVSRTQLADMHDMAIKAALKDQELAGIDIVSDGELRRDNDVDYFLARIPGVDRPRAGQGVLLRLLDARATGPLPGRRARAARAGRRPGLHPRPTPTARCGSPSPGRSRCPGGCDGDGAGYADPRPTWCATSPGCSTPRRRRWPRAGAELLQIDEPFLAGYPEQVELAIEAVNIVVEDVPVTWALHVCYGNRYARPLWEGHYDFLFPAVLDAAVDQLLLEFARKGDDDLRADREVRLGPGARPRRDGRQDAPRWSRSQLVERRIERALDVVPAERLLVDPDCGLRHLPAPAARAKLRAMTTAAAAVRGRLVDGG